jgi:hypothetical protein
MFQNLAEDIAEDFAQHQADADASVYEVQCFTGALARVFQNAANARYRASKRGAFMRGGQRARNRMPKNVVPLPGVDHTGLSKQRWERSKQDVGLDTHGKTAGKRRTNALVDCETSTEVIFTATEKCTALDKMARRLLSSGYRGRRYRDDGLSRGGEFAANGVKPSLRTERDVQRLVVQMHRKAEQLSLAGLG